MKNVATNKLGYTGIVTLSQYNGHKKIKTEQVHNAGGNSLFNFLADCLMGDFEAARLELPVKIKLLKTDIDPFTNESTISSASGFIEYAVRPERLFTDIGSARSEICYSFIIPRDIIENASFNSIGLYPRMATDSESDVDSFAAYCMVEDQALLSSSSVLVVDWKLVIENNEKSTV